MEQAHGRDPATQRTTRIAALIAIPVGVIAAGVAFLLLAPFPGTGSGPAQRSGQGSAGVSHPQGHPSQPGATPRASRTGSAAVVCAALIAQLPQRLHDRARQASGPADADATWGPPPITLACGVTGPSTPADAQLWLLNGVCWFSPDAAVWTTVDRSVPVTVTLTGVTAAAGQWIIDLSSPITATVPLAQNVPAGCT